MQSALEVLQGKDPYLPDSQRKHSVKPDALLKVPAGQAMQAVEPAAG